MIDRLLLNKANPWRSSKLICSGPVLQDVKHKDMYPVWSRMCTRCTLVLQDEHLQMYFTCYRMSTRKWTLWGEGLKPWFVNQLSQNCIAQYNANYVTTVLTFKYIYMYVSLWSDRLTTWRLGWYICRWASQTLQALGCDDMDSLS